jgi:hypothetical protein
MKFRVLSIKLRVQNTKFRVLKVKAGVLSLNGGDNKYRLLSGHGIVVPLLTFFTPNIFAADFASGFCLLSLRVGENGMVAQSVAGDLK